jgi:VIT1/CCC1 family predicted Fe2+/Mn2+ transporter
LVSQISEETQLSSAGKCLQNIRRNAENANPTKTVHTKAIVERHARPTLLSNFILGTQDGLVNVLGILLGLTAASTDIRIFFVAALAARAMGAVAYTSTTARRRVYLKEANRELQEMKDVPQVELEEVRQIFRRWGYEGKELEDLTQSIAKNPKAMLEFMMSYELDLAPVDKSEARRSAVIVGSSTIFASFIPLIPYLFVGRNILTGTEASVIFSGVARVVCALGARCLNVSM